MQPVNFRFGGGLGATFLHPFAAVLMLIAIVLIFVLPRQKVITPFLLVFFTIPEPQVWVVGGIHLTMHQILILAVLVRIAFFRGSGSEKRFAGGLNALDWIVLLWSLSSLIMFCLQFMQMQAVVRGTAGLLEMGGGYLAVRFLIPDREAVRRAIKAMALVCLIQGICMFSEQFTRQNVFAFLGGNTPTIRDGHVRAEGALGGLYAGVFAGVLIPIFVWLWTEKKSRVIACAGLVGATAMVFASFASTSWVTYAASLGALAFWPLRKQMRLVRWGIVVALVGLHLVMNGPVWSLIEHIDLTGGSSSYHRYMLIDNCIRHFGDWWLIGYKDYANWGFDMWDLCNQFVVAALTGGLITLLLFVAIYWRSFRALGKFRKQVQGDLSEEWLVWLLGATLFANVVGSFGINYMMMLEMGLFPLLACVSVVTSGSRQTVLESAEATQDVWFPPARSRVGANLAISQSTR
jgi:hypothetical protein